jgi:hypothetical protein
VAALAEIQTGNSIRRRQDWPSRSFDACFTGRYNGPLNFDAQAP